MRKNLLEFAWARTLVLALSFLLAGVISIPLQNNFNYNFGPHNGNQYVGNVQPVIPFSLTENWNVITRTIVPVIHQPWLGPEYGETWGVGDFQFTTFLTPAKPAGGIIWGVGPIVQFPSGTDKSTTAGKWAAGLPGLPGPGG